MNKKNLLFIICLFFMFFIQNNFCGLIKGLFEGMFCEAYDNNESLFVYIQKELEIFSDQNQYLRVRKNFRDMTKSIKIRRGIIWPLVYEKIMWDFVRENIDKLDEKIEELNKELVKNKILTREINNLKRYISILLKKVKEVGIKELDQDAEVSCYFYLWKIFLAKVICLFLMNLDLAVVENILIREIDFRTLLDEYEKNYKNVKDLDEVRKFINENFISKSEIVESRKNFWSRFYEIERGHVVAEKSDGFDDVDLEDSD